jgi:hypothetical protein
LVFSLMNCFESSASLTISSLSSLFKNFSTVTPSLSSSLSNSLPVSQIVTFSLEDCCIIPSFSSCLAHLPFWILLQT